jgi:hypothetical protein
MKEPAIAVTLLELFCRDEALVGDVLEEFEVRQSRAWLWGQVGVAIMLGLPYGMVRHPRQAPKMAMPVGPISLVIFCALITIVAPGAWWLIGMGLAAGVLLAVVLAAVTRRRLRREPPVRHVLLR